jgi:hypothetical protein
VSVEVARPWLVLLATAACGRVGFDVRPPDAPLDAADARVACYHLDDADPAAGIADSGPNGLSATCTPPACPVATTSPSRSALLFDGIDDQVRVPFDPRLVTASGLTLTLWMRADRIVPPYYYQSVFSKPVGTAFDNTWELTMTDIDGDGDTDLRFVVGSMPLVAIDRDIPFAQGQWAHVAATWDGGRATLFVDGVELGSVEGVTMLAFDNSDIGIGADRNNGAPDSWFQGALHDVCLYDRALTLEELDTIRIATGP